MQGARFSRRTRCDLRLVSLDLAGQPECFVCQVAPPKHRRAYPCHLRLVRALVGQQGFVVAVLWVDDDQALADREASSEEQQAGVEDHTVVPVASFQTVPFHQIGLPIVVSWYIYPLWFAAKSGLFAVVCDSCFLE